MAKKPAADADKPAPAPERIPDPDAAFVRALDPSALAEETATGKKVTRTVVVEAKIDSFATRVSLTRGDAGTPENIGGPGALFVAASNPIGEFGEIPIADLATSEEIEALQRVYDRATALCAKKARP